MSTWFTDPELFTDYLSGGVRLWRLKKKFGSPLRSSDFTYETILSDHQALVGNAFTWKKSDFDAFGEFIYRNDLLVNCQGLVLPITFPRDRATNRPANTNQGIYFWSLDVVNLPRYGLPVPSVAFREVRYMGGDELAPVGASSKEKELATKLDATTSERNDLAAKLDASIGERNELAAKLDVSNGERDRAKAELQTLRKKIDDFIKSLE